MAQYQVPQFIEIEDKIFGPLTLKQFVWLAGGGGLILALVTLLPLWLALIFALPVGALAMGLAFYKVNGRPLIVAMEHAFSYSLGTKLYLWKKREDKVQAPQAAPKDTAALTVPRLSQSRLKDIAWSLNIKDRAALGVIDQKHDDFAI